jgi:DeoR/GlpR family transcriptional regulator of sugar metabolism
MSMTTDGPPLLAAERHSIILEYLGQQGTARVGELARRLGVSEMTVRRDIDGLAGTGAIDRIHGGAKLAAGLSQEEPGFAAKHLRQGDEKRAIAREAALHVLPGMVIGISAGTTTYALSELIRDIPNITIVTNSIPVADPLERAIGQRPYLGTVLLTGGERTPSKALVGPIAISALSKLHVDALFIGAHGADENAGLTTPNLMESEANQMLIASAHRVFVLADHSKWGVVGMSSFAPLEAADVFITDSGLAPDAQSALRERVGRLHVVDV